MRCIQLKSPQEVSNSEQITPGVRAEPVSLKCYDTIPMSNT